MEYAGFVFDFVTITCSCLCVRLLILCTLCGHPVPIDRIYNSQLRVLNHGVCHLPRCSSGTPFSLACFPSSMLLAGTPSICGMPQRLGRKNKYTNDTNSVNTQYGIINCHSNIQLQAKCFFCIICPCSVAHLAQVRNGHVKRITDEDIGSAALEVCGNNVSTTTVTCPEQDRQTLGRLRRVVQWYNVTLYKCTYNFSAGLVAFDGLGFELLVGLLICNTTLEALTLISTWSQVWSCLFWCFWWRTWTGAVALKHHSDSMWLHSELWPSRVNEKVREVGSIPEKQAFSKLKTHMWCFSVVHLDLQMALFGRYFTFEVEILDDLGPAQMYGKVQVCVPNINRGLAPIWFSSIIWFKNQKAWAVAKVSFRFWTSVIGQNVTFDVGLQHR